MTSLVGEQVLLRAYMKSADRAPHTPTYERMLRHAQNAGMAGATVLRGVMGYGATGVARQSSFSLIRRVPIIVEIVDTAEQITRFIDDEIPQILERGVLTVERAVVSVYRHERTGAPTLPPVRPRRPMENLQITQRTNMQINANGILLRAFVGEAAMLDDTPLYEAILQKARSANIAGATVLRGVEGFGPSSIVRKAALLDVSADLPMIIEIVDTQEKIEALLPQIEPLITKGMLTLEYVALVVYGEQPAGG